LIVAVVAAGCQKDGKHYPEPLQAGCMGTRLYGCFAATFCCRKPWLYNWQANIMLLLSNDFSITRPIQAAGQGSGPSRVNVSAFHH